MKFHKVHKVKKEARTFMPEIIAPGTGLSTPTNKSVLPTNNVHTIQDVLDGRDYKVPGGGGNWSPGEDVSKSYKDDGADYKRKERDADIMKRMLEPKEDQSEKWKVRTPGGTRTFPSFNLVQQYRAKMQSKGVPIKWVARVAQKQDRVQVISSSLKKTFKVESIDTYHGVKETGAAFCVAPNIFMTCAHVVVSYDKDIENEIDINDYQDRIHVFIVQGGRKVKAEILELNAAWDVALLKVGIDVEPFKLDVASLAVGDEVLTIGSPHGFENNTSFGHVGSVGRDIYAHTGAPKYFFMDAPVFQGNSGGPIVKVDTGEVVGMLTSIVAQDGNYGLNVGLPSYYLQNFCIMNKITTI